MADVNPNPQGTQQGGQQDGSAAQQQLQVKVPDDVQKGVYSNAVSVNVNSNEIVLDFGYLLPNTPAPVIEVVSRVNMNQRTAESFLSVLAGAMDDFKKKQAQQQTAGQANPQMGPNPMNPGMGGPMPMGPAPMGSMGPNPMNPGMGGPMPMGPAPMGPMGPMPSYPQNA